MTELLPDTGPATNQHRFSSVVALLRRFTHQKVLAIAVVVMVAGIGTVVVTSSRALTPPNTNITVNGDGGDRTFDGVGAILAGGDNNRYLADYPQAQRTQILNDLFKPGYGASLQLLKVEIGGDDGGEASIEPARGQINCNAGYGLSIAQQAMAINPQLKLYGLQWGAPGWVGDGANNAFTSDDITYLLDWLGCAKQYGLTINYLGGWNESDDGTHAAWYHSLRQSLDAHGYTNVQIVAADTYSMHNGYNPAWTWQYTSSPDVSILGAHDICGVPTGGKGPQTQCSITTAARQSGKPAWMSEVGGMDAGAQTGCHNPCAPAMDRALTRGYIDARLTGYLEWPLVDAMPPNLPQENRGLITADQPWSGNYTVDAMTWAIAQFTQFVQPGWVYVDSASGYLQGNRADGSYVTAIGPGRKQWTTMIETTAGPKSPQKISFTVQGGQGLQQKQVQVWATNFNLRATPSQWFVQQASVTPNSKGQFSITVQPGYVYTLSTTAGQSKLGGAASGAQVPPAEALSLPYSNNLTSSGNGGSQDDETSLLASIYGAFEVIPCAVPDGSNTTCTEQTTPQVPVIWGPFTAPSAYYPYTILGQDSWTNYTLSSDILFTKPASSGGLVGRFNGRPNSVSILSGYVFDVNEDGAWAIDRGNSSSGLTQLANGTLSTLGVNTWHNVSLSFSGQQITASIDGKVVGSATDSTYSAGPVGLEAGVSSKNWPQVQYSNLTVK